MGEDDAADEAPPQTQTQTILTNSTPEFLRTLFTTAITNLEKYGWFILITVLIVVYAVHKYKPALDRWFQFQRDRKDEEEAKKNPDKTYKIQVSVEQARLKLQEQVDIGAKKRKEQQEKFEEEKRRQRIEEWEKHKEGKGYHSKFKPSEMNPTDLNGGTLKPKNKKTLRNQDYNPLSGNGDGGSCSYRPSRRNVSGGG